AAHEALDRVDGALRVGDRLALRDLADQPLAIFGERDDRGSQPTALFIDDDFRLAALHHSDDAVGGAEVDSDDLAHEFEPPIGVPNVSRVTLLSNLTIGNVAQFARAS